MKMYRTSSWGYEIEEFEVVKKTNKTVTYLEKYTDFITKKIKTKEQRVFLHSSYNNWHETRNDAVDFLLKRIDAGIKYAEYQIQKLRVEKLKLINNC